MEKMKKNHTKIFAGFITLAVIFLLVVSGPASALIIGLDQETSSEDSIEFMVWMNPNSGDKLNVNELKLEISSLSNWACEFDVDGNIMSGCDGLEIEKVTTLEKPGKGPKYEHGYGYNNAHNERLAYKITLDKSDFDSGDYILEFLAKIGKGKKYFSEEIEFSI